MKTRLLPLAFFGACFGFCASLSAAPKPEAILNWDKSASTMPAWMDHGVIYEINIRQYSEAGTFAAIEADMARIADLGVTTLWLMPIHPIGEVNRKGPMGSYYAVKDYFDVNPEFGDKAAFRAMVKAAHSRGMKVIIDWVANHSAWDNPLATEQPDLYMTDEDGNFIPPLGTDWTDVIQFNVENPALVDLHIKAMRYWVEEFGIDGYRCDFAQGLPVESWEAITAALQEVRPDIFMLAESEQGEMQINAFHATYGWDVMHCFDRIAQGKAPANAIDGVLAARSLILPEGAREMLMTSNHDENTWLGTDLERFGGGHRAFALLSLTMDGIPLIYNGQEAALDKRIEFFTKDPIDWQPSPMFGFYQKLIGLRKAHPALKTGAPTVRIPTNMDDKVYAFMRLAPDGRRVLVAANLTAKDLTFTMGSPELAGPWTDLFTGESISLEKNAEQALRSWSYLVLTR